MFFAKSAFDHRRTSHSWARFHRNCPTETRGSSADAFVDSRAKASLSELARGGFFEVAYAHQGGGRNGGSSWQSSGRRVLKNCIRGMVIEIAVVTTQLLLYMIYG